MFEGCISLKYLINDNFNTSLVNNMRKMFAFCYSLLFLNLTNFDTRNISIDTNMFDDINPNLTYCIDEGKSYTFLPQLSPYTKYFNFNCSSFYYDIETYINGNECIYEYNNRCYDKCPNETFNSMGNLCEKYYIYNNNGYYEYYKFLPEGYYIDNDSLKILGKCENKCNKCTKESVAYNNFCVS